jgi:Carboxypeptidase regulatory-like domain
MRTWWWRSVVLGLVFGTGVAAAEQGAVILGRPGTVPAEGVTGPRDRVKAPTGTARIRGLVVGGEGGAPLRRAVVRVAGSDLPEGRVTTTNQEGRWEVRDLPAGRYEITAMKTGYVAVAYGQRRAFEQGRPLEIRDAQTVENINFNLPRGSVIAGRVIDEFGDPVAEVGIAALRLRFAEGRRRMIPVGRFAQTDDGGNFRLYGLAPGDYYISASQTSFSFGESSDDRVGYAPTYYPGTASAQQADKVTVSIGDEVSGLVFSLVPTRTARISGTAVDSRGRPMAGAFISVMERSGDGGGMGMSGGGAQVREDGSFTISDVGPGDYLLQARHSTNHNESGEIASAPVTVNGEDLSGVTLVASTGTVIRGRVVFDVPPPAGKILPGAVGVAAMPLESFDAMMFIDGQMRERLNDDWTFELRAMAGPVRIWPMRMPAGYSLKQVFWRGQDITDSGLPLKGNTAITDVEVILTAQSTTVIGAVTDAAGKPVLDYVALLFAEDSDKWGTMSRYLTLARPDQQGGFVIKQLPPGRYLAAALPYLEDGDQSNPELLERLRGLATPFTLAEGGRQRLQLKVVEP